MYQFNWKQSKIKIERRVWLGMSFLSNLQKFKLKLSCCFGLFSSSFCQILLLIRSLGGHDLIDVNEEQHRCWSKKPCKTFFLGPECLHFLQSQFFNSSLFWHDYLMDCTPFCIIWPMEVTMPIILIFPGHLIVGNSFICMKWEERSPGFEGQS